MDNLCRRSVIISGKVQGVGFRRYARDRAEDLGLTGWVRNLPDSRVELHFQGEPCEVVLMEEWCHQGSPAAEVRGVEIGEEAPLLQETGFDIR